jgi:hypothetical protein
MEEVLSDKSTAATDIIVFFQIAIVVSLMMYVVAKARGELRSTLSEDFTSNCALLNTANPLLEV